MKGFVHVHWRILGTGFNISYLKKQAEIFQKEASVVLVTTDTSLKYEINQMVELHKNTV